ncbi:hypothetical protein [Clostridium estertheticum]|uniref:hypothetical protein n=1 Tax=Clostridium estertheticum TaxID=238834 RepID=UPI001C7CC947|nr:hypothetical protein [Clostridium estertheticum]MBX4266563.1 hypothetical protein [Clostridium estertheticum]WLC88097.1 hypothetical protein KTC95_19080 [Clostridium estertheticum]
MSNLKKALYVLLYDQSDSGDLEVNDSDETYVDHIVNTLIQENGKVCPFKNYDCIGHCKVNLIGCAEGLNIECNREHEDIWKDFIGIETEGNESE